MGSVALFLVVFLAAAFTSSYADRTVEVSGVFINVQSKSGRITLGRRPDPRRDEDAVTIALEELRELDSNGNEVGLSSSAKHSFSTFEMEDFTISNLMEMRYANQLDAAQMEIETTVNYARVKLTLYIFKEGGKLMENGDHIQVRNGTVRLNIEMSNWGWCNPCLSGSSREYGYYLELMASIKGRAHHIQTVAEGLLRNQPKVYDLGYGSRLIAPRQAMVDSRTVTLAPGYPAMREHMGRQKFVMRFPKFTYKLEYDPIIQLSGSSTTAFSFLGVLLCGLAAFIL